MNPDAPGRLYMQNHGGWEDRPGIGSNGRPSPEASTALSRPSGKSLGFSVTMKSACARTCFETRVWVSTSMNGTICRSSRRSESIGSGSKTGMYVAWGFALFWNLVSAPLPFVVYQEVEDLTLAIGQSGEGVVLARSGSADLGQEDVAVGLVEERLDDAVAGHYR